MSALKRLFKPGKKKNTDPHNKSPNKSLEDTEEADDGDWTMISHEESPKKASKDDFEVEAKLGKGAFGMVLKVKKKATGETFAMKVINKKNVLDHGRVKDLFSERSVLRMTKHPFIVQLEAAFQSETKLFFIMEYLPGGDLDGYLRRCEPKRFEESLARVYAAEVYLALRYLHDQKIIYRDLKPENILLDSNGHACLSDFGLSKVFETDNPDVDVDLRADSFVGSPFYVSPDVLRQREYGAAVDWWSFGVLLFRMITGGVPFTGGNIRQVFDSILRNKVDLSPYPWVSTEAQDLISNLLQKDAAKRLTGDQVKEHPWFAAVDWDRVYAKRYSMKFNQTQSESASPSGGGAELGRTPPGELNTLHQKYFDGFSYQNSGANSLRAAASNNSLS